MNRAESDVILFSYDINGAAMRQLARFPYGDSPHDEATPNTRDPVVRQAIATVTSHQPMEEWWALSPGVRSQAIFDEIKRLDRAGSDKSSVPIEEAASAPHYQMA
jgi:hypothetical protein